MDGIIIERTGTFCVTHQGERFFELISKHLFFVGRMEVNLCKSAGHWKLLVDPLLGHAGVGHQLLWLEPKSDLLLGAVDGVATVADVSADVDAEVAADRARGGSQRVGGTEHGTALLDGVLALPDHGADWATGHVLDEAGEEALAAQVGVVLLEVSLAGHAELQGGELVAASLESGDDVRHEAALDAVRLDSNEGSLGLGHDEWFWCYKYGICKFDLRL